MCSWCSVQTEYAYTTLEKEQGGAASLPWSRHRAVGTLTRCGKWLSDKWAGMSTGLLLLPPLSVSGFSLLLSLHPFSNPHSGLWWTWQALLKNNCPFWIWIWHCMRPVFRVAVNVLSLGRTAWTLKEALFSNRSYFNKVWYVLSKCSSEIQHVWLLCDHRDLL